MQTQKKQIPVRDSLKAKNSATVEERIAALEKEIEKLKAEK